MTMMPRRLRRMLAALTQDERDGPLPLLLYVLTVVTGLVDAISFLRLGDVFVANMTGNIVFLGLAAAEPQRFSAGANAAALISFFLGAAAGGRLGRVFGGHRARLLLVSASIKIPCGVAAIAVSATSVGEAEGWVRYAVIILLAVSMGLQNAVVRRLAVADLTTTVLTGTLTSFAADSSLAGGGNRGAARRVASIVLLGLGAALGALLLSMAEINAVLAVTLTLLIGVWLAAFRLRNATAPWAVPPG
jgi:uncharacterized membrane protein YoaK (UPF0700 family)